MKNTVIIIAACLIIVIFTSCSTGQNSLDETNATDEFYRIDELESRIDIVVAENHELRRQNEELFSDLEVMIIRLDELEADDYGYEIVGLNDKIMRIENDLSDMSFPLFTQFGILDSNVRRLYELTGVDEYNYFSYSFEKQLEYVATFEQLMNLYSYQLDGIYSESFSVVLGNIYRELDFVEFIHSLSMYNDRIIDDLSGYLVYDIGYREGGIDRLKSEIDAYVEANGSNKVIVRIEHYLSEWF